MKTQLQAKIEARNAANKFHNLVLQVARATFAPLVGQKILKADGSLLEKFAKRAPSAPGGVIFNVYKLRSDYSLAFVVRACVNTERGCAYEDATAYIGNLNGQTLESLIEPQPLRDDYTAEEIIATRKSVSDARETLRNAESALAGFGEYDR